MMPRRFMASAGTVAQLTHCKKAVIEVFMLVLTVSIGVTACAIGLVGGKWPVEHFIIGSMTTGATQ